MSNGAPVAAGSALWAAALDQIDSPAKAAKVMGTSVAEMAEETKQSRQTLQNWFHRKPELFRAVAVGVAAMVK